MNDLQQECVCFSVSLSRPSLRRKVKNEHIEVDAEKDAVHVSKEILSSDSYNTIQKLDGEIRGYLYSRCVPSLLRKGIYLLPLELVAEIESKLVSFAENRDRLVSAFCDEYEVLKTEAKIRLRSLYEAADYPSVGRLRSAFSFQWRMFSVDTPEILSTVSRLAYEREQAKAEAFWAETKENVAAVLRAELKDLVDHLVERLQDDPTGQPKIFRNSLIANFEQWTELFKSRNLAKDHTLAQLVERARNALASSSADDIRDNARLRQSVRASFEVVKNHADKLVIEKPRRAIHLEE